MKVFLLLPISEDFYVISLIILGAMVVSSLALLNNLLCLRELRRFKIKEDTDEWQD